MLRATLLALIALLVHVVGLRPSLDDLGSGHLDVQALETRPAGAMRRALFGANSTGAAKANTSLEKASRNAGLQEVSANDFHGLHDILLIGYSGIGTKTGEADEIARQSVENMIELLPQVHPVPGCRAAIDAVLQQMPKAERHGFYRKSRVVAVAQVAWDCLPAKFTTDSFNVSFTQDNMHERDSLGRPEARNPKVEVGVKAQLGACRGSSWDRTCSFWSLLHVMTARAEMAGIGPAFVAAWISAIFSGATMCKG